MPKITLQELLAKSMSAAEKKIRKVLLVGSGPIAIGQAAEFDYSGTQACLALREEGLQVVLVNSNPATIQTDLETADKVYIEPLNAQTIEKIIEIEKPDAFLGTMAGQTGLNLAVKLKEFLKKREIQVLGTQIESIELAEDREKFAQLMKKIKEPIPSGMRATSIAEAKAALQKIGLPLIIRADFALGGAGSGIVEKHEDFEPAALRALEASGTKSMLIEKSISGLCEIEYEVVRDAADNCITICNMENIDPIGVHTGESVVVAPAQTLSDCDHQKLRTAAIKIIRALDVRGACNVQFALNQKNGEYFVVEVNPRVSRSSALASKATGYPIARVASKIALGKTLPEITNKVTGKTACFEPALDYVVVKIPRWPFDKFGMRLGKIGTQMKSTGETMAIGRTFEEAFNKAVRSLETRSSYLALAKEDAENNPHSPETVLIPNELRMFHLKEYLRMGKKPKELAEITKINEWFLQKLSNLVDTEFELEKLTLLNEGDAEIFARAKKQGFSDHQISSLSGRSLEGVRLFKEKRFAPPAYNMIDTCAGEFPALTPYYYSTYGSQTPQIIPPKGGKSKRKVIILGSGPIRIGQGIEFDYCTVHAVMAIRKAGFETIIINNNPETVSTDFDISDKLYFEPLTLEDVQNIAEHEKENLEGVLVQFGGQTAINLALPLQENGVKILGTPVEQIEIASDRKKFKELAHKLSIPLVNSEIAFDEQEALALAGKVGFPILIRPSFVLGGRAMQVAKNAFELKEKIAEAVMESKGHSVILDHFLENAVEIDVDILCDGKRALVCAIMEQIEEAGVHSGDSACTLPAQNISEPVLRTITDYSEKLALALQVKGLCNIQMAVKGGKVFVLEVNPRASRTIPFASKAIGLPIAKLSALVQLGKTLDELGVPKTVQANAVSIKMPVFPFIKFPEADPFANAEMKSTGEVMAIALTFEEALLKAHAECGNFFGKNAFASADKDTVSALEKAGIQVETSLEKAASALLQGKNAPTFVIATGQNPQETELRKLAIKKGVPVISSKFGALAIAKALAKLGAGKNQFPPVELGASTQNKSKTTSTI